MRLLSRLFLLAALIVALPGAASARAARPPGAVAGQRLGAPSRSSRSRDRAPGVRHEHRDGNPHSDLDFFERGGETFASVGTLGRRSERRRSDDRQLTQGGDVAPKFLSSQPSASCVVNEAAALGLQHDVEASPKGDSILNTFNPFAETDDAQVIIDATDASGRCHDSMLFGGASQVGVNDKRGGLEIIDITDPAKPKEIGLTSHVGEAHTVNIDPKRPHIAYASTSDAITVTDGRRTNTTGGSAVDGFEVVDFSSCLNFAPGTSLEQKRERCKPEVFRYRYPELKMVQGHTNKSMIYGCHELEIYPNDRLACAGGSAMPILDMSGAFDDRGTPDDFTDDKPRGRALPCTRRASASLVFETGAQVVDCVDGTNPGTDDLIVSKWLQDGAPSLEGVQFVGSVFHQGREASTPAATTPTNSAITPDFDSTQDIDFNHEAEFSQSGNLLIATDERGGGVLPPGATCSQANDVKAGNGGVHFYRADALQQSTPEVRGPDGKLDTAKSAEEAFKAYARTPEGGKAIYRAPVRTGGQATVCTAHVMQQIPGQNRIFMGWYSQGTQVLDFTENPDGTVSIKEAGHFIPVNANEWVSHIFKAQENPDGSFTYFGATGDFNLGEDGRNAIDVYQVTLPAPPKPADGPGLVGRKRVPDPQRPGQMIDVTTQSGAPQCVPNSAFRAATVQTRGRRTGFAFQATGPVTVDVFRQSAGRRVTGERLVRRFANLRNGRQFDGRDRRGRRLSDGYYVVRFGARGENGVVEYRRVPLLRRNGRFTKVPAYSGQDSCGLVRSFKLERPVFGGRGNRALNIAFRLGDEGRATVTVARTTGKVVKTFPERSYRGGQVHRLRLTAKAKRFPRGRYIITLTVRGPGGETITQRLRAARL
jgi:hypothetical protein